MIVVDVETTGVIPHIHSLLSVGAVDFANPSRQFYEECRMWEDAHVSPEALAVNGFSREEITDLTKETDKELVKHFLLWTMKSEEVTLAGENPSFDRDFLHYTALRHHIDWPLAHRTIDLHTLCYYHMVKREMRVPLLHKHSDLNLDTIAEYVGLKGREGIHKALEDARLEAEALSRLLYKKNLLPDFKNFPLPAYI